MATAATPDPRLAESYEFCRYLHRHHGRTFYLATRLLPAAKRRHVHALYGFTRHTDDIVDEMAGWPLSARAARLHRWVGRFREALDGDWVDDPVLPAFLDTMRLFDLDRADFEAFLRSMEMDLTITAYDTYDDLLDYMNGSAAAIVSMVLPILGVRPGVELAVAREPARQLGIAFQLTNFIRDVEEDFDRGRIYLPLKDLAEHGVTPDDLAARVTTAPIRALIAYEIRRARKHYALAAAGIPMLQPRSQACIRAAFGVYGAILDDVERADNNVFGRRATVGSRRRLSLAVSSVLTRPGREVRL
jgi:phytoene synthase